MTELPDVYAGEVAAASRSKSRMLVQLQRVKFLIFRYWWIVALTVIVGLMIQGYRCLHLPTRYISQSRMMMSGHLNIQQGQMYTEQEINYMGTQIVLMKSRSTKLQAIERVSAIHPEVPVDDTADVDAGVEPRTTIFDLTVTSADPQYAKLLLDAIMDTYLETKRGHKNQATEGAVAAITEEISRLDAEIRNDEQELLDFQKENNVVFIEEQSSNAAAYLVSLNNELARLTRDHDLLSLESQAKDLTVMANNVARVSTPGNTNAPPGAETGDDEANQGIVTEQDIIDKLKIARDQYGVYLKDKHPKMIDLADSIDKEQKFLDVLKSRNLKMQDEARVNFELQIKNVENQITEWNKKSLALSERLGTYQQLKSQISRDETLYNQLASSIQSVDLTKQLDEEGVDIMEAASPAQPVDPNFPLQMLWGLAGGLAAGIAIIYFVHRLDDTIDSPMAFEENIEFPLIGQIPRVAVEKKSKRVPLLAENDQRHIFLESLRNIRSAILFRPAGVIKPRSLMICSAAPAEGKSTFSANLGIIFAYSGTRVLLIDADLRRGVIHTLFKTPLSPGLSDYLQQQASWRETIQKTNVPGLDIIPRGKVPHHPGDLLLGSLTDVLLQESVAEYDIVLWDSAPLFAADDAANLCSRVEGILFIARVRYSSINSVRSALEELSQRNARIFGVVLNAVEPNQPGYYDRYRYKQYYAAPAEV